MKNILTSKFQDIGLRNLKIKLNNMKFDKQIYNKAYSNDEGKQKVDRLEILVRQEAVLISNSENLKHNIQLINKYLTEFEKSSDLTFEQWLNENKISKENIPSVLFCMTYCEMEDMILDLLDECEDIADEIDDIEDEKEELDLSICETTSFNGQEKYCAEKARIWQQKREARENQRDKEFEAYLDFTIAGINIGKPSKKAKLKDLFRQKYGKKTWRNHWEVYKKDGGNKKSLNRTWEKIDALYEEFEFKDKTAIGEALAKTSRVIKKFNLAPLRGFALLFIRMNVFNLATLFKLAKTRTPEKYPKITKIWKNKLGGKIEALEKNIEIGYKKKPIASKNMNIDWKKENNFISASGGRTVKIPSAFIGAAPALGAGIGALWAPVPPATIGGAGLGTGVGTIAAVLMTTVNLINIPLKDKESDVESDELPTAEDLKNLGDMKNKAMEDGKKSIMPTWQYAAIGGIGLLLIGTIYLITKKPKKRGK